MAATRENTTTNSARLNPGRRSSGNTTAVAR